MASDPDRHRLAPEQHRAIYADRIAPRLFRTASPVETPTAVVLGGQPGAGKSAMIAQAAQDFREAGGIVRIIGDNLRSFHPGYEELQRRDDRTAAFFTDRDSGQWIELAIADAARRRCNVVVEGTMRVPDKVAETLALFRSNGYATDARALAVSPELSALGILQRFVAQKEDRGFGRMTSKQAHNAALAGMLDTLDRIQDERLADRLTIYRRGNEALHSIALGDPAQPGEPRARAIVEAERARPLARQEADYVRAEMQRLAPALRRFGILSEAAVQREQPAPRRGADRER